MFSIDKEKFGSFVAQLRKEKGLMQKELAEKLYISDKAVSKWERGLSIPDVALLVPLAEILGVTVTELLECRRIPRTEPMDSVRAEELVQKVIGMGDENRGARVNRGWPLLGCVLAGALELWLLALTGIAWGELMASLGTIMFLMAVFGLYFCVFARVRLPKYYDENRISSTADGFVRINLPGVCFNNNNWPHVLRAGQLWCLLGLTLTPAVYYLFRTFLPEAWSAGWVYLVLLLTLGGLFVPMTIIAKRYEYGAEQPPAWGKSWRDYIWIGAVVLAVGIVLASGSFSMGSGLRVGWSERKSQDSWYASYAWYDGWRQRTVNWNGEADILYAEICTEAGELGLTVTDREGNILFSEENVGTESFEIPIAGKVMVRIDADGHSGSLLLYWK